MSRNELRAPHVLPRAVTPRGRQPAVRVGDHDDRESSGKHHDHNQRLAPYLPRLVIDWMSNEPTMRSREIDATIVFIDISGFTKLSERLARDGNIGAEELATTIGSTFTDLLAVAYANGGRLLKFGGDALLLFFDGDRHPARACHSAVGMRRSLREQGALSVLGQKVRLRMSVGPRMPGVARTSSSRRCPSRWKNGWCASPSNRKPNLICASSSFRRCSTSPTP